MKKILGILMSIVMVAGFYACSDDDYVEHVSTLKIVESDVTFTNKGGSGYIDVESPTAITAKSTDDWCAVSVSGNRVTVTTTSQPGIESRNSLITIYNSTDSVKVPVNQSGSIFYISGDAVYIVKQDGSTTVEVTAKATKEYTTSVSADWIHYTVGESAITFTFDKNEGGYRKGEFTITSVDGDEESIIFGQMGTSYAGKYMALWQQYDSNSELQWYYTYVTLSDEGSNVYNVNGLVDEGALPWTYSESTGLFEMNNGYYIGEWVYNNNTYYLYTIKNFTNAAGTSNYISYNTTLATYHMFFEPEVTEDGDFCISFTRSPNLSASYTDLGFYVYGMTAKTFASANSIGYVYMFRNLTLYSVD